MPSSYFGSLNSHVMAHAKEMGHLFYTTHPLQARQLHACTNLNQAAATLQYSSSTRYSRLPSLLLLLLTFAASSPASLCLLLASISAFRTFSFFSSAASSFSVICVSWSSAGKGSAITDTMLVGRTERSDKGRKRSKRIKCV